MNFPRTILDFQQRFASEQACWEYLVKVRWPDGFACPRCGAVSVGFTSTRKLWQCRNGHQTSATAETVMHRTHLNLRQWFWAAYLVATQTPGISAMVLHRQIGVGYETAYMVLQRLRAGMVNPGRTKLREAVEVDETYISGGYVRKSTRHKRGRGTGRPMVIAAVETYGKTAGRVRLRKIRGATTENVRSFLVDHVEKGSLIISDGLAPYPSAVDWGFRHITR